MCNKRSSVNGNLRGRATRLDACIRKTIERLNQLGVDTIASCCGHDRYSETILVRDQNGDIIDYHTNTIIPRRRRFYQRDTEGFYYIKEMVS